MWERRDAYAVLVRKPEGKSPLARPKRRRDYSIEVYLKNICWEVVHWSDFGWEQVKSFCELGNEPWDCIKCGEFIH